LPQIVELSGLFSVPVHFPGIAKPNFGYRNDLTMNLTFEKGSVGHSLCLGISLAFGMAFATHAQKKQTEKTDCGKNTNLEQSPPGIDEPNRDSLIAASG
jgi:hypothetical protein